MKLNRDLWQPSNNCHPDRKGRANGKKKRKKLWPLPCMDIKHRKTFFSFSPAYRQEGICEGRGLNRANKKQENRREVICVKETGPNLRSELKSSTKMISWMRLGGVRFRTLQGPRKEKATSWAAIITTMLGLIEIRCAVHYSRSTKLQWNGSSDLALVTVLIGRTNLQVRISQRLMASQPDLARTQSQELWDLSGAPSKGCCSMLCP